MVLAIDIGNTNIKSALFQINDLTELIVHKDIESVLNYISTNNFSQAAICSVNPNAKEKLQAELWKRGVEIFTATVKHKLNLEISYKTPETLGIDRVCSTVGALDYAVQKNMLHENQYLITADFGTATTVNIVSPDNKFLGGLISPGIRTMLLSLKEKTSQLPLLDYGTYTGVIGDSTNSAILNGVFASTIGMISETINQLKSESNCVEPLFFATGGHAEVVLPHIKHQIIFQKDLVLRGLKVIYDLNN